MIRILKKCLFFALLLFIYIQISNDLWLYFSDKNRVLNYIETGGVSAIFAISLFGIAFTALGGPRQLIAAVFGFVFGGINGTLLALLICIIAATVVYGTARYTVQVAVHQRYRSKLDKFENLVAQDPFFKILMLRLLPVGSNLLTNLLSGGVKIRFSAFLWGSLLGYIPQTLIFALAGAGVGGLDQFQLTLSIGLGVISMALGSWLYRSHLQRKVEEIVKS